MVDTNRKADIIAGLSVAGLILPEAVAYAHIAGLPPSRAILAVIAGGAAYCIFGRSRFAVIAPTSSSAAMLAAAIASLPGDFGTKAAMATALVGLVGVSFLLINALRLGALSGFVARPVLHGFAFGLAITIIVKQLPVFAGIPVLGSNPFSVIQNLIEHIDTANLTSVAMGMGALALLLILRRLTRLPAALIVLSLGILLTSALGVSHQLFAVVGPIPLTIAVPSFPVFSLELWSRLAQLALPLTLILFAESWGTIRTLALRHGDSVSAEKELVALGASNIFSAMVQGIPVGAGFSAGSANETAGATSRWAAAVAITSLAALVLFAGQLVARIPEPILAAIVIAALGHAVSLAPIKRLFVIKRDGWIAIAAATAVIGLGVLNGMLVAIALSVAILLHRLATPSVSTLGQLDNTHDFVDIVRHKNALPIDGIVIFRPNAPLFFANVDAALSEIASRSESLSTGTTVIVSLEESDDLDSSALEALIDLEQLLKKRSMYLMLARVHDRVRDLLTSSGYARLATNGSFSVADAVSTVLITREMSNDP